MRNWTTTKKLPISKCSKENWPRANARWWYPQSTKNSPQSRYSHLSGLKASSWPILHLIAYGNSFLLELRFYHAASWYGSLHADPRPGNLLVDEKGNLCLLDFGLFAEVDEPSRNAKTKAIIHLLVRLFDALVSEDAIELGFLPFTFDESELKLLLSKILTVAMIEGGSNLWKHKKKLMDISNELNEVFFKYPFRVPSFFALVTRGLGLLEGIALTGDPDFDISQASAPYTRKRAFAVLGAHTFRHFKRESKTITWKVSQNIFVM